jgi:hypothetical protein
VSARLWKIEPLGKPSLAHAADAVEIVGGEAVRRVTLSQLDYQVYTAVKASTEDVPQIKLAEQFDLPVEEITAALRRLVAAGLLDAAEPKTLQ